MQLIVSYNDKYAIGVTLFTYLHRSCSNMSGHCPVSNEVDLIPAWLFYTGQTGCYGTDDRLKLPPNASKKHNIPCSYDGDHRADMEN